MRYRIVVYQVPDPTSIVQHILIDQEFDSDLDVDAALIVWASDWDGVTGDD